MYYQCLSSHLTQSVTITCETDPIQYTIPTRSERIITGVTINDFLVSAPTVRNINTVRMILKKGLCQKSQKTDNICWLDIFLPCTRKDTIIPAHATQTHKSAYKNSNYMKQKASLWHTPLPKMPDLDTLAETPHMLMTQKIFMAP